MKSRAASAAAAVLLWLAGIGEPVAAQDPCAVYRNTPQPAVPRPDKSEADYNSMWQEGQGKTGDGKEAAARLRLQVVRDSVAVLEQGNPGGADYVRLRRDLNDLTDRVKGFDMMNEAKKGLENHALWKAYDQTMKPHVDAMNADLAAAKVRLRNIRVNFNRERQTLLSGPRDDAARQAARELKSSTRADLEQLKANLLKYSCWEEVSTFVSQELDPRIQQLGATTVTAANQPTPPANPGSLTTSLSGGCSGTINLNALTDSPGADLVYTVTVKPPAHNSVTAVTLSDSHCQNCPLNRLGAHPRIGARYKLIRKFPAPSTFTTQVSVFAGGNLLCSGTTATITSR